MLQKKPERGFVMAVRRKCFISYHHADQAWVDHLVRTFDHGANAFIARGLGQEMPGDVVNSNDTDYVLRRIRELYIADSTVTIVFIGAQTWSRRYVDWEIEASLKTTMLSNANGLLGIKLPTAGEFPPRFNDNLLQKGAADCYARHMPYPQSEATLLAAIEEAYAHRTTHAHLIDNSRTRMLYNRAV